MQQFLFKPLRYFSTSCSLSGRWFLFCFFFLFFFKEVISYTKRKYFFTQDIIKLEFIATGCCGCQKSRWVQKAIKQIHGREVHQGQLNTKIQSLAQEVLSHSLLEAGRGKSYGILVPLHTL